MEGKSGKQLIVVGDRVLIEPEAGEGRSKVGLYLPASAVDKQSVQGGRVLATGPVAAHDAGFEHQPAGRVLCLHLRGQRHQTRE
jgi:co-chaperonin GroES (HSP10)